MTENVPATQDQRTPAKPTKKAAQIEEMLRSRMEMVASVLPQHITPERMLRVMFFSLMKTPKLQDCTPASLMEAMVTCSEYGLEPGPQGHVYLIPRNCSVKDPSTSSGWRKELRCIVQVGWRGLAELAWRSGALQAPPQAHTIHENDTWSYELGLEPKLLHKPALSNRGAVIAAYAVAHLKGADRPVWRILGREDLDRRAAVGDQDSDARKAWGPEMDAKTALRALCTKDLPMSPEKAERLYKVIENENELPEFGAPMLTEDPKPRPRGVAGLRSKLATPELPPAEEQTADVVDQPAEPAARTTRARKPREIAPADAVREALRDSGAPITEDELVAWLIMNRIEVNELGEASPEILGELAAKLRTTSGASAIREALDNGLKS